MPKDIDVELGLSIKPLSSNDNNRQSTGGSTTSTAGTSSVENSDAVDSTGTKVTSSPSSLDFDTGGSLPTRHASKETTDNNYDDFLTFINDEEYTPNELFYPSKKILQSFHPHSKKSKNQQQLPTYSFLIKDDNGREIRSSLPKTKWWHYIFIFSFISFVACIIQLWVSNFRYSYGFSLLSIGEVYIFAFCVVVYL